MDRRLELHEILCEIINITEASNGNKHVYYQPPESLKLKYPAIVYSKNDINNIFADDLVYNQSHSYEITVIDKDPDSKIVYEISKLPRIRYDRHFVSDNLNHDVFTLIY